MSSKNNIKNSSKILNKLESQYKKTIIDNNSVSYSLIGLIILYIVLTPMIPVDVLLFLNNIYVRILCILIICLLCLVDPIKAILLAIALVVSRKVAYLLG